MRVREYDNWTMMKLIADALLHCGPTPVAQLAALTKLVQRTRPAGECVIALSWGSVNLNAL